MNDVKARIASLEAALELRKLEQEWPMDDLSRSLLMMYTSLIFRGLHRRRGASVTRSQ